jgi:hypothetical protein
MTPRRSGLTVIDRPVIDRPGALDDYAGRCIALLGVDLSAYLAGANSVREFQRWRGGADGSGGAAARRLAAVAEVIGVFSAENLRSAVPAWLREVGADRICPADRIRAIDGDDLIAKSVVHSAAHAVAALRRSHFR